jgi:hypothetical protein
MIRALYIFALASFLHAEEIVISAQYYPPGAYIEEVITKETFTIDDGYLDNYYVKNTDWTLRQKRYATSYILANIVDAHQTVQITNCQALPQCGVIEMNPLLGNRPSEEHVYLLKGTLVPLLFYFMNDLESSTRTNTLKWINRFQWSVVVWNDYHLRDQYGVELKYKF